MAKITLEHVKHSYSTQPGGPQDWALKEVDTVWANGGAYALLGYPTFMQRCGVATEQQQRTALARALVKNAALVLLDEPLVNLDYKLREELRDQLPKLFKGTGTTVVYATSEPLEALMLGGNTATLHEGRVTQYGPTAKIYRTPNTLLSAQVFSDPPINTANTNKKGGTFHLTDAVSWPIPNEFAGLGDGSYTMGIRPHHLTLGTAPEKAVKVRATVLVAEISGSESVVHVNVEGNSWVSESHGIHPYKVGDSVDLFINVERCLYFGSDGQLLTG